MPRCRMSKTTFAVFRIRSANPPPVKYSSSFFDKFVPPPASDIANHVRANCKERVTDHRARSAAKTPSAASSYGNVLEVSRDRQRQGCRGTEGFTTNRRRKNFTPSPLWDLQIRNDRTVDHDDANRLLAEAIGAVVREAVKDALREIYATNGDTVTTVSVAEAAQRLGLGKTKVNELIASGDLPSVLVGKRRLLRPADLEAFAARQGNGK